MAFDPMDELVSGFKSGQKAYGRASKSAGLGQLFQAQAPQQLPPASTPSQQPAAPAPQPAVAGAVSEFEGRLNAARPGGWPAVQNVYNGELEALWLAGADKNKYDQRLRGLVAEEEQAAAQAAPAPAPPPVV